VSISAHARTDGSGRYPREVEILSQESACLVGQLLRHLESGYQLFVLGFDLSSLASCIAEREQKTEHVCCLAALGPRYFILDGLCETTEAAGGELRYVLNPDTGTYSIGTMAVQLELLIAAELAPRCRIGVA